MAKDVEYFFKCLPDIHDCLENSVDMCILFLYFALIFWGSLFFSSFYVSDISTLSQV